MIRARLEPVGRPHPHGGVGADLPPGAAAAHRAAGGDARRIVRRRCRRSSSARRSAASPWRCRRRRSTSSPCSPSRRSQNSQVGVRLAGRVGGIDLSVSYYHGRFGIPTPAWAVQKPNGIVDVDRDVAAHGRASASTSPDRSRSSRASATGSKAAVFFPQKVTYGTLQRLVRRPRPDHLRADRAEGRTATTPSCRTSRRPSSSAARSFPIDAVPQADRGRRLYLEQVPLLEPAVRLRLHRRVRRRQAVLRAATR